MRIGTRTLPFATLSLLFLASCQDQPSAVDSSAEVPTDLLQPALDVLDGHAPGGNEHFFWLPPLGSDEKGFPGVADGGQLPAVEICVRDENALDGCAGSEPLLARFTRASGPDQDRITVDDKSEYFVHWRMNSYPPERDGQYRIRVLIQDTELGHADVIVLRQRDIKAYNGDLVPVSDRGELKIAFRIEEGALCSEGALGCSTGTEIPGDGVPTTVNVPAQTVDGDDAVGAVVTAPDGVFTDENGDPLPEVTVSAAVKVGPPSTDILTNDSQELPFFIEIKTFPADATVDPNGPGVSVVICQDEDELANRGIGEPLHPQLVLYKVHEGVTERLVSTFGAPECEGYIPPAAPPGLLGMLRRGAADVLRLFGPEPVVARRRLHGGLNTVVKSPSTGTGAFSTFGSALGPDADSTNAVVPAMVDAGDPVAITIQVENALGEAFLLSGDTLDVTVRGANPTSFVATDVGNGMYTGNYTATNPGVDSIDIVLIRNDGVGLGPIDGSPYIVDVSGPFMVLNTNDSGAGSLRQAILDTNANPGRDTITFAIPGSPYVVNPTTPLPAITDELLVDGTTQPGYAGSPVVEVSGSSGYGFDIQASNTTLRGLAITQHALDGVFAESGLTNVRIVGNTIGTDAAGSTGRGNANAGIRLRSSNSVVDDNVISGNVQNGILVEGSASDTISGNTIGLAPDGVTLLPNQWSGITMYDGSSNTVISGNTISGNVQWGVDIQHSGALAPVTGTQIHDNTIGLDVNGGLLPQGAADWIGNDSHNYGPKQRGNLLGGVRLDEAPGTVVGPDNAISGNTGHGVAVLGSASPAPVIRGNRIGTDAAGIVDRGNTDDGIHVEAPGVVIGGTTVADRNLVSANLSDGIRLQGSGGSGTVIVGNYVGTDASGNNALGNGRLVAAGDPGCCHSGIQVDNATGVVVGGTGPGERNHVSANHTGLWIGAAPGIHISGNVLGSNPNETGDLPNDGDANIALYGTQNAVITENHLHAYPGGYGSVFLHGGAAGNQLLDNIITGTTASPAIALHPTAGSGNTFQGNALSGNGFGIDLGWNGVTLNDALDADVGPNDLVNTPELLAALNGVVGGSTQVQVRLNAAPSTVYAVELFTSPSCNASGFGEGAVSLGLHSPPATDGAGQLVFAVNVPTQADGTVITATATDPSGSTSEFSACETVGTVPAGVFYWAPSSGGNGHFYQYVPTGSADSWTTAKTAAEGLGVLGHTGHLVTITSGAEQAFVESMRTSLALPDWRPWIGLWDASGSFGWQWVTGEPFAYTNWGGGEPNNMGSELYVEMYASGEWNNNSVPVSPYGYLVEYDVP